ncbi:heavy metal translocating P-type ATPase [Pseudoruegeria sp. HB172150]|uniref:heavy metal translocating P-type ATPase n=1 Tax=Pseudoruegeria sp. HB172150 TaxID=2721164 RepID=UPI001556AE76|nr:heavy metal translocating P-type ATPase [Pseudoruegeria sp. HB172150]
MAATAQPAACPACAVAPAAAEIAGRQGAVGGEQVLLSLPEIHCAACISGVERSLSAMPGVRRARVNLTLKRATVDVDPGIDAAGLARELKAQGWAAHELDTATLAGTQGDRAGRDLLMRLGVAGFAMMNVMLLSVAIWSGAEAATRDMFHWISAAIALPAIAFSAQPFFRHAWTAVRAGRLNMDVPISLAILLAAGLSIWETAHSGAHAYFDAALSLTFFLLAGRYLDHRTRSVARSAAQELAALEVPRALRISGTGEAMVPVAELAVGDVVRVLPGQRVPVDGVVESGASEIDRSLLTGESLPVQAAKGGEVNAGEVNLTGVLTVRVTAAAVDSTLHRLADLVAVAESTRNRYTSLADRAARIYAPAVHLLALGAFVAWLVVSGGDVRLSLNIAVAVLIITCPCALGLAVPAVTTAASGRLFKRGLLIKSATALERLAEVDTVVFDKTGTLTAGMPELENLDAFDAADLSLALALAEGSAHPLSVSLANAAKAAGIAPAKVALLHEVPGYGVAAEWRGQRVRLGRAAWVGKEPAGQTTTYLQIGERVQIFRFADRLREGAAEAVAALKAQGMDMVLLSGDAEAPVADLAGRLGIGRYESGILPHEKAARVEALAAEGRRVLMVGDGLNDTGAMAAAHASISPASALEATRVVSDIVLLGGSLAPLGETLETARSATRRIRENFGIAAAYNAVAIPVALLGFATPLAAALAMSASSICVSLNALRLR